MCVEFRVENLKERSYLKNTDMEKVMFKMILKI
jgi:hypothetical protein